MKMRFGFYRHYKGSLYRATGIARHSETLEDMVIYHNVTKPNDVWIRPLEMFLETVRVNGQEIARFEFIGSELTPGAMAKMLPEKDPGA